MIQGDQWKPAYKEGHDGMVHLFMWPWPAIAEECENFLGPHKFGAVQISPPNEAVSMFLEELNDPSSPDYSAGRPWYDIYQPATYELNSRMGTEAEFIDMVERCNNAGVRIIVDAVINHMMGAGWKNRPSDWWFGTGLVATILTFGFIRLFRDRFRGSFTVRLFY